MILLIDLNHKENSLSKLEFVKPIENILKINNSKYLIKHFSKLNDKDIDSSTKIILCGTSLKDNNFIKHYKRFLWIKNYKKPILGICAGMQIIGKVFGSKLKKCKEIGLTKINLIKTKNLFNKMLKKEVYSLHNFSITCPKEFEIIAKSNKCVQAIKHKEKPIYAVLFHPEVLNKELISEFIKK